MLTVGHYASQLEAAYQPAVQGGAAAPENYPQDRVSWRLPALPAARPTPTDPGGGAESAPGEEPETVPGKA